MEKGFDEGMFVRKGHKSAFHCLWQKECNGTVITPPHYHNYVEILYGDNCDMDVWVNDKTYRMQTGDIIIIRPNETHTIISEKKAANHIVIKFLPQLLNYEGQNPVEMLYLLPIIGRFAKFEHIIPSKVADKWGARQAFADIAYEFEKSAFGYEIAVRQGILQLFSRIIRYWYENDGKNMFDAVRERDYSLWSSIEFISENYAEITEQAAAEKCAMSYSYFSRMFKRIMKMSFSEYVMQLRIEKAVQKLLTTDMSVTLIAQETGFSTASHFISNFKKIHGISPLVYRKRFKENFEVNSNNTNLK